ncbi:hypothetical protein HMN09_01135900 [Mycena chlorophos]|uniref:Uncharacterized protein n=1 Tax=Mycena chlorophos TaxID=658473 RepID=A0A8H6VVW1_MYCCL|nr:hypothetical protein HMN09_01135900 [Mycena chlorophos]
MDFYMQKLGDSCDESDRELSVQFFAAECDGVGVTLNSQLSSTGQSSTATSAQSTSASANGSTTTGSTSSPSPTTPTHSASATGNTASPLYSPSASAISHHTNNAAIGGAVGGVLALLLACFLVFLILRRRRRTRQDYAYTPAAPQPQSPGQRAATPPETELDPDPNMPETQYIGSQPPAIASESAASAHSRSESTSNRMSLRRPIAPGVVASQTAMLEKAASSAGRAPPVAAESTSGGTAADSETETQRQLRAMTERVAFLEAHMQQDALEPPPQYS